MHTSFTPYDVAVAIAEFCHMSKIYYCLQFNNIFLYDSINNLTSKPTRITVDVVKKVFQLINM